MKRILVIEDEQEIRENLAWLLEAAGYEALGAANGKEGIALARSERPDLILCDIMMPEMDGYEVLLHLRQDPRMATTPLVFLTALSTWNDIRTGVAAGADDYITKPFSAHDVLHVIQARLDQHTLAQTPCTDLPDASTV